MSWVSLVKRAFVLLCLLSLFFINAHNTTPAEMLKKEVKFQKVKEKTYDKRIGAIAFAKTIVDGKQKVYPKVIAMGGEVQFLDERGEIISRKSLVVTKPKVVGKYFGKEVIMSSKGSFVAIREYTGEFGDPMNYIVEEEFTICNDKGEEVYRIKGPAKGMTSNDRWLISDKDGTVVGTRIEYGAIDFYSPDGKVKTVQLFSELGWKRRTGRVSFSGDGEYLAVLLNELVIEIVNREEREFSIQGFVWVILFDKTGNELWRRKVDELKIGNITVSENGEYLVFKAYSYKGRMPHKKGKPRELQSMTLSLYDKEGNDLTFTDTSLFTFGGFCFAPQADYVALRGANIIRLTRTKDGSTVFEKELPKNRRIRDILFSKDGQYLIVKAETRIGVELIGEGHRILWGHPVFLFNMKGDQVWQKDFRDLKKILSLGVSLVFTFPHRYEVFKEIE